MSVLRTPTTCHIGHNFVVTMLLLTKRGILMVSSPFLQSGIVPKLRLPKLAANNRNISQNMSTAK